MDNYFVPKAPCYAVQQSVNYQISQYGNSWLLSLISVLQLHYAINVWTWRCWLPVEEQGSIIPGEQD